jgi:hypothetical protein
MKEARIMMRGLTTIAFLGLVALVLLPGCEGETGPAGPAGSAACEGCHSDEQIQAQMAAFRQQYETSVHATGGHWERNSGSCAGCHTNEGFQGLDASNPSAIGCITCHDPHNNFDFSVRKEDPVTLVVGGAVYDKGKSNLCANCHQARIRDPWVEDFPDEPGSTHWGPHHGPQSNVMTASIAYDFEEGAYGSHSFHPFAPNGCIQCHMATPDDGGVPGFTGGHTWNMEYDEEYNIDGCNVSGCHDDTPLEDFSHRGLQEAIHAAEEELLTLLTNAGLLEDGHPIADRTYTKEEIGVVLNFLVIEEDRSYGVHNPTYMRQMAERTLTHARALAQTASNTR